MNVEEIKQALDEINSFIENMPDRVFTRIDKKLIETLLLKTPLWLAQLLDERVEMERCFEAAERDKERYQEERAVLLEALNGIINMANWGNLESACNQIEEYAIETRRKVGELP